MYDSFHALNKRQDDSTIIISTQQGDVTGDGTIDQVYIQANMPYGKDFKFYNNLTLIIESEKGTSTYKLPYEQGFNTRLFIAPFEENNLSYILITTSMGNPEREEYALLYTFKNNELFLINNFSDLNQINVTFKDFYKVEVSDPNTGNKFLIDISQKNKKYLDFLYDADGKLKNPVQGTVTPLGQVYPIDIFKDGIYELQVVRPILGISADDILGYWDTIYALVNNEIVMYEQNVGILPF